MNLKCEGLQLDLPEEDYDGFAKMRLSLELSKANSEEENSSKTQGLSQKSFSKFFHPISETTCKKGSPRKGC